MLALNTIIQMEDPSDDPREFQHHPPSQLMPDHDPPGMDNFLRMSVPLPYELSSLTDVMFELFSQSADIDEPWRRRWAYF
jgi:hypothetical protein